MPIQADRAIHYMQSKPTPSTYAIAHFDIPDTPFPHLIRSNIEPDEDQIRVILQVIDFAKVEESWLLRTLSTLDLLQSHSLTEKDTVENGLGRVRWFIREHRAMLSKSPWQRRIPPELLELIFHQAHGRFLESDNINRKRGPPWAISQVCSLWRDVALNMPTLWTELPPIDLSHSRCIDLACTRVLQDLLTRSRQEPINLQLVSSARIARMNAAADILVAHAERWQRLELHSDNFPRLCAAIQKTEGRLPSLEALYIRTYKQTSSMGDNIQLFKCAPRLREVDIGTLEQHVALPYTQLTEWRQGAYRGFRFYASLAALACYTNLRVLSLVIPPDNRPFLRTVHLPNLVSLCVSEIQNCWDGPVLNTFMRNLKVPMLEELHISAPDEPRLLHVISSFISQSDSPCLLKLLYIGPISDTDSESELIDLLKLMPLITSISVPLPGDPGENTALLWAIEDIPSLSRLLQSSIFRPCNDTSRSTGPPFPIHPNGSFKTAGVAKARRALHPSDVHTYHHSERQYLTTCQSEEDDLSAKLAKLRPRR